MSTSESVIERKRILLMDSGNSTTEPTASSSQQKPIDTRGVIIPGQTVLFRLPRGDTKCAVLKPNSFTR